MPQSQIIQCHLREIFDRGKRTEAYPVVARGLPGLPPTHAVIGGKRILDCLLFWLQHQDVKFAALDEQYGPKEALEKLLTEQTQRFHTRCMASDVMLIAERFHSILKEWEKAHPRSPRRSLVIGGSFINGKWRQGSDIDMTFSDYSSKDLMELLDKATSSGFSAGCTPELQLHVKDAMFYGRLNPFALEITADTYQLYVFKPAFSGDLLTPQIGSFKTYKWSDTTH